MKVKQMQVKSRNYTASLYCSAAQSRTVAKDARKGAKKKKQTLKALSLYASCLKNEFEMIPSLKKFCDS